MFNPSPPPERAPQWPFSLNHDSPQARGLVAWYPLVSATQGLDLGGRGHHGTLNNNAFASPMLKGFSSEGVEGAGTSSVDRVNLPPLVDLGFADPYGGPISLELFAHVRTVSTRGAAFQGGAADGADGIYLYYEATANAWRFATETWNVTPAEGAVAVGETAHIVCTWDGTTNRIYINTVEGSTGSSTATFPTFQATYWLDGFTSSARALDGWVKDGRIYNRVLSEADVKDRFFRNRWDLYWQPLEQTYFFPADAPLFRNYSLPSI